VNFTILKSHLETQQYVAQVCNLADQNKDSFGFLAASAYEDLALKGQLWVAICEKGTIQGYLMFGGKMPTLKVSQLYVCIASRSRGLGKLLIQSLISYAEKLSYHTVTARVASDLPANKFWEASGFRIYRQEKGGKTTGRTINIRAYKLTINDLLSNAEAEQEAGGMHWNAPVLNNRTYAVDLNPIFDVTKNREHANSTLAILQMGMVGDISLCLTPEFKKEIDRYTENYPSDSMAKFALMVPVMRDVSKDRVDSLVRELRSIVFPRKSESGTSFCNDYSDLSHIAYCIVGNVDGLITREKALLRASPELIKKYGIAVLSPDELLPENWGNESIAQKSISSTIIRVTDYLQDHYDEVINFLESIGVTPDVVKKLNLRGVANRGVQQSVARYGDELVGFFSYSHSSVATKVATVFLFVNELCQASTSVIDHFLEACFRYKTGYIFRIDIYVSDSQLETVNTAINKGFLDKNDGLSKLVCHEFVTKDNWDYVSASMKELFELSLPDRMPSIAEFTNTGVCITDSKKDCHTVSLFDFETILSPMICLLKERGCVLVPIKENYAIGLMGDLREQLSLLDCSDQVLMLEKAYFRSSVKSNYFNKGTIVAFYVSHSLKEFIGFARVTHSEVLSVEEALIKFKRQGVLSREELVKVANNKGQLHAFTFDNFFEFKNRLSFSKAKAMGLIGGANLVSVEKVNHTKMKQLINEVL
jgi:L-amino acid N-acyltransferase YncA